MLYPLSRGAPVHFYSVYRQQSKIADQDRFSTRTEFLGNKYLREQKKESLTSNLIKVTIRVNYNIYKYSKGVQLHGKFLSFIYLYYFYIHKYG